MMYNKTTKKTVEKRVVFANSLYKKIIGLMFKKNIDYGMVFIFYMENYHSFHTFFMKFNLDFVFLSKEMKVLKIIRNVAPWKMNILGKGKYVIELEAGKSKGIHIGDTISFI